jgi:hypothetical protein
VLRVHLRRSFIKAVKKFLQSPAVRIFAEKSSYRLQRSRLNFICTSGWRAAIILLRRVLFILYFNKDLSYSLYLLQTAASTARKQLLPLLHVQRAILRD